MLLVLASAAAEAGYIDQAAALATYIDTNLQSARYDGVGGWWLVARLEQALGDGAPSTAPALHRRELMALIDEVELALTGESA